MKKIIIRSLALSVVFVFLLGLAANEMKATNYLPSEDIPVEAFSAVSIGVKATVYLEQSSENSLKIETSDENMAKIEIEVKNNVLVIKPESYMTKLKGDVTIWISSPGYEKVSLAGSGNIIAEEAMKVEDLLLVISGSGNMEFADLSAEEIELKISGSGNATLAGPGAEELEVSIAGSGNLDSREFRVSEFEANISGSGDCKVNVSDELDASIAGSGSVYYLGNPVVNSSVAGSGKVKSL